jgi:hypothetical protein
MASFDEVRDSFWSGSVYFGAQQPLTDEAVEEAESVLGVTLPSSLLELLRIRNGGIVADRWNAFPTSEPTSWTKDHVPFNELMGIGRAKNVPPLSLLWTPYLVEEWGLPSPIVLLSGDGRFAPPQTRQHTAQAFAIVDLGVAGRQADRRDSTRMPPLADE